MRYFSAVLLLLVLAPCSMSAEPPRSAVDEAAVREQPTDPAQGQLGTVVFPVSCSEAASQHMERGVALLHHMMYAEADRAFASALAADPNCALGYWGRAMTLIHPLWPDVPTAQQLQTGWDLYLLMSRADGRQRRVLRCTGGYSYRPLLTGRVRRKG